ncbi:hypothetical protein C5167_046130 [Papaver somniferum]|uniref:V-type proton ATPase subunit S1/VOA1 transmembrane domain-containing protein n=1 Tax=Papaver somniferum TaxID=3469 RepID=A0A4Y7LCW7_PAPSO|nr:uncharacterized protein LOC113322477 isoform X1 [Papaver somniferum]RZC83344.1 hypothetical protein C5167_046130 [Papaver somniferum]
MKGIFACVVAILLVVAQIPSGLTLPSTVPAFLWSSQQHESLSNDMGKSVDYRTISQKDLAKSVLSEGGWSKFLCSEENRQQSVDFAIVFVGKELQLDISRDNHADSTLMQSLQVSFESSNFSRAFPYVAVSQMKEVMESSLLSGFAEACPNGLGIKDNIALLESCSVDDEKYRKLSDMDSVYDYLISRMANRQNGQTEMVVLCNGGSLSSEKLDHTWSEGQILSSLVSALKKLGASYTVLYASDASGLVSYPSYRELDRFLAEGSVGNGSQKATYCDGVCQIKSSLLEGLFVAIVLLIILISGLCCMMGIDAPTRFEAPQDS